MKRRSLTFSRAARRQAIIRVALDLFLENGYSETTMSAIAARLGGSKNTLWSYFPTKLDLFRATIDQFVDQIGCRASRSSDPDLGCHDRLMAILSSIYAAVCDPDFVRLSRIVVGESNCQPGLSQAFFETFWSSQVDSATRVVRHQMDHGPLKAGDPAAAARELLEPMVMRQHCLLLGLAPDGAFPSEELDIGYAVERFLAKHGAHVRVRKRLAETHGDAAWR